MFKFSHIEDGARVFLSEDKYYAVDKYRGVYRPYKKRSQWSNYYWMEERFSSMHDCEEFVKRDKVKNPYIVSR